MEAWMFEFGIAERRGFDYAAGWPQSECVMREDLRWAWDLGYRLGRHMAQFPDWVKYEAPV